MDKTLANTELQTLDALALAFAAQRANGTHHKVQYYWNPTTQKQETVVPNKQLMLDHVTGAKLLAVTDQDRIRAADAREFLTDYHVMATLQETHMSPWMQALIAEAKTSVTRFNKLRLLSFVPEVVSKLAASKAKQETVQQLTYTSQHIGRIGERFEFAVSVIDKRTVVKLGCYFVFGYTPDKNCVGFFTSKNDCTVNGVYTGKVKRHTIDSYRNDVKVTEFNYVKPVKVDAVGLIC